MIRAAVCIVCLALNCGDKNWKAPVKFQFQTTITPLGRRCSLRFNSPYKLTCGPCSPAWRYSRRLEHKSPTKWTNAQTRTKSRSVDSQSEQGATTDAAGKRRMCELQAKSDSTKSGLYQTWPHDSDHPSSASNVTKHDRNVKIVLTDVSNVLALFGSSNGNRSLLL